MKWSIPEKIVGQGRELVDDKQVTLMSASEKDQLWFLEVTDADQAYSVSLDGTSKEDDGCSCEYWQGKGFCKHTVAGELYLKDHFKTRRLNEADYEVEEEAGLSEFANFIDKLSLKPNQKIQVGSSKDYISLDVELESFTPSLLSSQINNDYLRLTLKAGLERLYVVDDIYDFVQSYKSKQVYKFANGHQIDFGNRLVRQENRGILNNLDSHIKIATFGTSNRAMVKKIEGNKKYLLIQPGAVQPLLEALNQAVIPAKLLIDGQKLSFSFQKEVVEDLILSVKEKDGLWEISHNFFEYYVWPSYGLIYKKGTIYPATQEFLEIYHSLWPFFQNNSDRIWTASEEQAMDFLANNYSKLAHIFEINLDQKTEELVTWQVPNYLIDVFVVDRAILLMLEKKEGQKKEGKWLVETGNPACRELESLLTKYGFIQKDATTYYRYIMSNDHLVQFENQIMPYMTEHFEVELDDSYRDFFVKAPSTDSNLEFNQESPYFKVTFDLGQVSDQDIRKIIRGIQEGQHSMIISGNRFVDLDDWSEQIPLLSLEAEQISQAEDGHFQLKYRKTSLIGDYAKNNSLAIEEGQSQFVDDLMTYLNQPEDYEIMLPKTFKGQLQAYQETGVKWMSFLKAYGLAGILADDMGLGKTVQTIAFLSIILEKNPQGRFLVVCPASVVYNWAQEFEKFAPDIPVWIMDGDQSKRQDIFTQADQAGVILTSYQSFRNDNELYASRTFDTLILDEAQVLKNFRTKSYRAVKKLDVQSIFALTGTPIENSVEEYWALFQLILPGLLPSLKIFNDLPIEEIRTLTQPFILRRRKDQVLENLPSLASEDILCQMTVEQKEVYLAYLEHSRQLVRDTDPNDFGKERMTILAAITRLRQIAVHPILANPDYQGQSGKFIELYKRLDDLVGKGHRVLIFSQFTQAIGLLEEQLTKNYRVFTLTGQTPKAKRAADTKAFNEGQADIYLISLKAGGVGLNLTGADRIVMLDLWWNPQVEAQAMGRAHRIGQKSEVEVVRLISQGTLEERIVDLQGKKQDLFNRLIENPQAGEAGKISLSREEIENLLGL